MYNMLSEYIKKEIRESRKAKYISDAEVKKVYLILVYLKFLCDKYPNNYSYDDNYDDIFFENLNNEKDIDIKNKISGLNVNKLINYLRYENLEQLVNDLKEEYKQEEKIGKLLLKKEDKILFISTRNYKIDYLNSNNCDYLTKLDNYEIKSDYTYDKILDQLFNLNNQYISDITKISNYNVIYILDKEPIYRYRMQNIDIMGMVDRFVRNKDFNGKVILKTRYAKVSILRERYLISNHLSKVILDSNKNIEDTYLEFTNVNKKEDISIVLHDSKKELDYQKIIDMDEPNDEYLIKISPQDIINNNYRIGFSLYTSVEQEKVTNITALITENRNIIDTIKKLDSDISEEFDKIFVK